MLNNQRKLIQIIYIIYCGLLLFISIIPSGANFNIEKIDLWQLSLRLDYFLHFSAYFGFYILLWLLCILNLSVPAFFFKWLIIVSLLLSVCTELIQLLLPYRTFNPFDLLSNISGIILGTAFFLIYKYLFRKKALRI